LIAGKNICEVDKLIAQLKKKFKMNDLGAAKKILGIEIHRNRREEKLFQSQKKYIEKSIGEIKHAWYHTYEDFVCYSFLTFNIFVTLNQGRGEVYISCSLCKCSWKHYACHGVHSSRYSHVLSVASQYMNTRGKCHWQAVK